MTAPLAAALLLVSSLTTELPSDANRFAPSSAGASGPNSIWVGGGLGPLFPFSGGTTLFQLSLRGAVELPLPDPRFQLQILLPLELGFGGEAAGFANVSLFQLDVLPSARFLVLVIPSLRVYADAGLGVIYEGVSTTATVFGQTVTASGSSTGLGIRVAFGVEFTPMDRLSIWLEPFNLLIDTATTQSINGTPAPVAGTGTASSLLAGVSYRL